MKIKFKKRSIFSAIIFAAAFFAFWYGTSSVLEKREQHEIQILEKAVAHGITSCYAAEGSYPQSLAYLKENYGLVYNEDKFFIDYQPLGANIMPDVTILRKKDN